MEADEYLVHGSLPLTCRSERGWRGAIAAAWTRLMKAWVSLYAPPPRHELPVL